MADSASGDAAGADAQPPAPLVGFKKRKKGVKSKQLRERTEAEDATEAASVVLKAQRTKGMAVTGPPRKKTHTAGQNDGGVNAGTYTSDRSSTSRAPSSNAAVALEPKEKLSEAEQKKPKWKRTGPHRAPANLRVISVIDYNPSLCKDYKETGFCGYGDNCKFMHDRGDYKSGWQLEQEYKAEQERKMKIALGEEVEDEEDWEIKEDEMPWACLICRKDYTNPVVTKCEHYFCEKCALQHFAKDSKCAGCGEQTYGIFNTATKLLAVLKMRKEKGLKAPAGEGEDEGEEQDGQEEAEEEEEEEEQQGANEQSETGVGVSAKDFFAEDVAAHKKERAAAGKVQRETEQGWSY